MYINFRNYQIQEKRKGKTCPVVYFQGPGGDPGMFGKLSIQTCTTHTCILHEFSGLATMLLLLIALPHVYSVNVSFTVVHNEPHHTSYDSELNLFE